MAFNVEAYINILRRVEQDQGSMEGRVARLILLDPTWNYMAPLSVQQAASNKHIAALAPTYRGEAATKTRTCRDYTQRDVYTAIAVAYTAASA